MTSVTIPNVIPMKDLESREQNEEKIKNEIVLPYLKALGLNTDRVEFETTFSITLGRNNEISIPPQMYTRSGRLDILCYDGDTNYFIIEVKSEGVSIDDKDIKQGVSYARLIHPIAPFVIITNGKETRVIDSITMEDIEGELIDKNGTGKPLNFKISAKDSIEAYYKALKYFIGYSDYNLKQFNEYHLTTRMSSVRGSSDNLTMKYIPELFIEDKNTLEQFDNFLNSDNTVYGIIGEGGVGKTNIICDLALRSAQNNIVLFFLGTEIYPDLMTSISNEFNWIFSETLDPNQIINRLLDLLGENNHLIFFIDAIDECARDTFSEEIDDLVRKISRFKHVKVCLSCKSSIWDNFCKNMGIPTVLGNNTFTGSKSENDIINFEATPGVALHRFNESKVQEMNTKYQQIFKYQGEMSEEIQEECKLPFMMRIVAEVYAGRSLPDKIDNIQILKEYLEKKYEKMNRETARNTLTAIARSMIESPSNNPNGVSEDNLRKIIGLNLNETFMPDLFDHNILSRYVTQEGLSYISFYFTKIRDFMIAIESYQLLDKKGDEFQKTIILLLKTKEGQSALGWYSRFASPDQYELLLKHYKSRALIFVGEYSRLIDNYFPHLKQKIIPLTELEIGLIMEEPTEGGFAGYSFRPNNNGERVIIVSSTIRDEIEQEFYEKGGYWWQMGGENFLNISPKDAAKKELINEIDNITIRGELNDQKSNIIATEIISAFVYSFKKELEIGDDKSYHHYPIISEFLPLDYNKIRDGVYIIYAKYYARDIVTKNKLAKGDFNSTGPNSYYMSFSPSDFELIEELTHSIFNSNEIIVKPDTSGAVPPFDILLDAISELENKAIIIDEPILPEPDIKIEDINYAKLIQFGQQHHIPSIIISQFSEDRLIEYIRQFYLKYLEAYEEVIDYNFSEMKSKLPFYQNLYYHVHVMINPEKYGPNNSSWSLLTKFDGNKDDNNVNIKVETDEEKTRTALKNMEYSSASDLSFLFSTNREFLIQNYHSLSTVAGDCRIRNMVYKKIKEELGYIYGSI